MHALVVGFHYGGFGGEGQGGALTASGEDGGDEAVDVAGLGFDHEDDAVVAEVGVGAVEHGEIGLEEGVMLVGVGLGVFFMGVGILGRRTMSSTHVPL